MACPYFMPTEKIENGNWPHPRRLPLGCGWSGHCTAPGHEGKAPSQDVLEAFCNLGYASSCSWAPPQRTWDAVRFAVAARGSASGAVPDALPDKDSHPARLLCLTYVCERDHLPVEHGELQFDLSHASWINSHADARVQKMAQCFLESYLQKKS